MLKIDNRRTNSPTKRFTNYNNQPVNKPSAVKQSGRQPSTVKIHGKIKVAHDLQRTIFRTKKSTTFLRAHLADQQTDDYCKRIDAFDKVRIAFGDVMGWKGNH